MIDFEKLQYLNDKVKSNTATQKERDEYMSMLYNNGSITKNQYEKYIADKNSNDLLNTAITIAGILLLGYLISKLAENNQ
ncbi:hypothetical protein [Flavobacterium sp. WV_118_3]|uniref:hypothetical protein n=1 Tax=Flavobacterium sp. WV_118_3 TaxID=3151764 RepID=UPI00321A7950